MGEQLVTEGTQARVQSWKSLVQFEVQAVIPRISIKPESKNTKICLNYPPVTETLTALIKDFFSFPPSERGGGKELPSYLVSVSETKVKAFFLLNNLRI